MMNSVAIYYQGIIIYWSTAIIIAGVITGFAVSLTLAARYTPKRAWNQWLVWPVTVILSLVLSRIIHWYCNKEMYDGFKGAILNWQYGGYCISGVVIAMCLSPLLVSLISRVKYYNEIFGCSTVGFAFSLATIRFADIYSDICRGKFTIYIKNIEYHFPSFLISSIFLLVLFVILAVLIIKRKGIEGNNKNTVGEIFLTWFSASEIVIDSTRYDTPHLVFYGERLAGLNKGAGFMGLSQLVCAICMIVLLIIRISKDVKEIDYRKKYAVARGIIFFAGLVIAGISEYLVQRYSKMATYIYILQLVGTLVMGASILYKKKIINSKVENNNGKA